MSRPLTDYGIITSETEGMVLQDSALFDSLLIRTVEDLDVTFQVSALVLQEDRSDFTSITPNELINMAARLDLPTRIFLPDDEPNVPLVAGYSLPPSRSTFDFASDLVSRYQKGPLDYQVSSLVLFAGIVAAFTTDFLVTGGLNAQDEDTRSVQLRHYLPACDRWPWPLDRFC
jgi:hypothetical protein